MQHWFFLMGAIALEVAGTTSMKLSEGFTKLVPSLSCLCFMRLRLWRSPSRSRNSR